VALVVVATFLNEVNGNGDSCSVTVTPAVFEPPTFPVIVAAWPNTTDPGFNEIETPFPVPPPAPGAAVLKLMSWPLVVPDGFVATSRKWYVVEATSPVTEAVTFLLALPLAVPLGVVFP
jgi:hypothetical protein